jgi:hypothetical protein
MTELEINELNEKATHSTLTPLEEQWLKDSVGFIEQLQIERNKDGWSPYSK